MTTFKKVKGNFDRLFDKNLTDLVRGIRNNKESEAKYVAQCMEEIKEELRQENPGFKANAVAKLTYLQMLGYDVSWASFNIIEVMSSNKFTHKRIGYLCASQTFHESTDVLMLTTNMIRKDLNSQNMYDAGCAMSGLSCFVSPDLSRDLANDVMTLLSSTKPYIRKKAVLLLYKIFLKFPDALPAAFPRLKEKLEDPDPGVQSAAVNVICELARANPRMYLSLAPVFFKLMTTSTNNWMLIKIIKLFGSLTPLEPRLGKKLIEPLTNLIHSTSAMSLLYECINTVIAVLISISSGLPNHNASIQLCVQKLRILIEDSDQNLKYLGLLAMSKILKTHPKSVQSHKDLILNCLDDKDESIRLRALDLLYGMVSKKNLIEIVRKLMANVTNNSAHNLGNKYRDELIVKIIDICSQNDYQFVSNFEWYVSVLVDLARVEGGTDHGSLIAMQMLDVAIRVESIRPFAVKQMAILVENCSIFANNTSVCEVLYAAAWICGEFSEHLEDRERVLLSLLPAVRFPDHIESVFIHNSAKLFMKIVIEHNLNHQQNGDAHQDSNINTARAELASLIKKIEERLINNYTSDDDDLEVNDRSQNYLSLINCASNWTLIEDKSNDLFTSHALNPVASKAQKKVPVPIGLDLDQEFVIFPSEQLINEVVNDAEKLDIAADADHQNGRDAETDAKKRKKKKKKKDVHKKKENKSREKDGDDGDKELASPSSSSDKKKMMKSDKKKKTIVKVEVAEDANNLLIAPKLIEIPGLSSSSKYSASDHKMDAKKKKKMSKSRDADNLDDEDADKDDNQDKDMEHVVTIKGLEMPDGVVDAEEDEDDDEDKNDPHKALSKVILDPLYNSNNSNTRGTTINERLINVQRPAEDERMKIKDDGDKKKMKKKKSSEKDGEKKKKKKKKSSDADEKVDTFVDTLANIPSRSEYEEAETMSTDIHDKVTLSVDIDTIHDQVSNVESIKLTEEEVSTASVDKTDAGQGS